MADITWTLELKIRGKSYKRGVDPQTRVVDVSLNVGTLKQKLGGKVKELFVWRHDGAGGEYVPLEDDRSLGYYSLKDGDIIETCSNPHLAACASMAVDRAKHEKVDAFGRGDKKGERDWQSREISGALLLSILFNSRNSRPGQPRYFPSFEAFEAEAKALAKERQKRGLRSWLFGQLRPGFERFHEIASAPRPGEREPLSRFIEEFCPADDRARGAAAGGARRRGKGTPSRASSSALATVSPAAPRLAAADAGLATPPSAKRRRVAARAEVFGLPAGRAKGGGGAGELRAASAARYSLDEEALKARGQGYTESDLADSGGGATSHGAFDGIEGLIEKGLVEKENTAPATYSLKPAGRSIAQALAAFEEALEAARSAEYGGLAPLPPAPDDPAATPLLLMDANEPSFDKVRELMGLEGLRLAKADLKVGDYVALPPGAEAAPEARPLPLCVERKTWLDLANSLRDGRFERQKRRMKASGLAALVYLVEGSRHALARPGLAVTLEEAREALAKTAFEDALHVVFSPSLFQSSRWIARMARLAARRAPAPAPAPGPTLDEVNRVGRSRRGPAAAAAEAAPWAGERARRRDVRAVWAKDFVEAILAGREETLRLLPPAGGLLLLKGLEKYNREASAELSRLLRAYVDAWFAWARRAGAPTPDAARQRAMADELRAELRRVREVTLPVAVSHEWQLCFQVERGVHVWRAESQEAAQEAIERWARPDEPPPRPPVSASLALAPMQCSAPIRRRSGRPPPGAAPPVIDLSGFDELEALSGEDGDGEEEERERALAEVLSLPDSDEGEAEGAGTPRRPPAPARPAAGPPSSSPPPAPRPRTLEFELAAGPAAARGEADLVVLEEPEAAGRRGRGGAWRGQEAEDEALARRLQAEAWGDAAPPVQPRRPAPARGELGGAGPGGPGTSRSSCGRPSGGGRRNTTGAPAALRPAPPAFTGSRGGGAGSDDGGDTDDDEVLAESSSPFAGGSGGAPLFERERTPYASTAAGARSSSGPPGLLLERERAPCAHTPRPARPGGRRRGRRRRAGPAGRGTRRLGRGAAAGSESEKKVRGQRCGACGEAGHARSSKHCPRYDSYEEVARRRAAEEKREGKKREQERLLEEIEQQRRVQVEAAKRQAEEAQRQAAAAARQAEIEMQLKPKKGAKRKR
eukprot:tig00000823_g4553.t1